MAINQYAFQSDADSRGFEPIQASIALEHVSVSQLLGRDYIFIDTQQFALPIGSLPLLYSLLDDLIARLELVEAHTVAISVQESPGGQTNFVRHDLTWHKHKICRVESTDVTQPEQYEFMDMIWRCSTSAIPA
ncbi:MAG: hypothetical protein ABW044_11845 [Cellvibrio sp.]